MRKIITEYSLLIFVGLDLVCIKCDQFIHPVKDKEYEILLKLRKRRVFSASRKPIKTASLPLLSFGGTGKNSARKNMLFYDGMKVLCLLFLHSINISF